MLEVEIVENSAEERVEDVLVMDQGTSSHVSFSGLQQAGVYSVAVTMGGKEIPDGCFDIAVVHGKADCVTSTVLNMEQAEETGHIKRTEFIEREVLVEMFDMYKNPCKFINFEQEASV